MLRVLIPTSAERSLGVRSLGSRFCGFSLGFRDFRLHGFAGLLGLSV